MLNQNHLDPSTKALVASTIFGVAGVIGWYFAKSQVEDATLLIPLLVFYATLTINTYSSIKLFSSMIPVDDIVQECLDFVLVIIFLSLAYSLRNPTWFFLMTLFLFIVAPIKYICLLGRIPHPKLLKRKLYIELLGTLLVAGVVAGAVLGYPKESAWTLAIVFAIANVYWLLINPMYKIID